MLEKQEQIRRADPRRKRANEFHVYLNKKPIGYSVAETISSVVTNG